MAKHEHLLHRSLIAGTSAPLSDQAEHAALLSPWSMIAARAPPAPPLVARIRVRRATSDRSWSAARAPSGAGGVRHSLVVDKPVVVTDTTTYRRVCHHGR